MASERIMVQIAHNLRTMMAARGWTQSELGRRAGLPPSRIHEILSGKHDPRVGTIEKLANALGFPSAMILGGSDVEKDLTAPAA